MNVLWSYFWPVFAIAAITGGIAGSIGFRRPRTKAKLAEWPHRRNLAIGGGIIAALAAAALWHGPLGGAARLTERVENTARQTLDYYEMFEVTAKLHQDPLSRRILLAGPADDFQRSELIRIIGDLPGVSEARWTRKGGGMPLIAEAGLIAITGFLLGLLLAYLVELRRRYNAQWSW